MNNIVNILTRAKSFIDTPEKWHKGDWQNETGNCFCTMGAIVKALDMDICSVISMDYATTKATVHEHPATLALRTAIGIKDDDDAIRSFDEFGSVASWNDKEHRTHDEVMKAFDKAIANASQSEA